MSVPPLLTVADLAKRIGVSRDYAYDLCASGEIAVTRLGRSIRVTEDSLAEYVAAKTAKPRRSRKGSAA